MVRQAEDMLFIFTKEHVKHSLIRNLLSYCASTITIIEPVERKFKLCFQRLKLFFKDLTDPSLAEQEQVKYHIGRRWVWQIIVEVL